jgi:hypothetical protein
MMTNKRKWLLSVSVLLTIYLFASTAYYLITGDVQMEGHPIFGALYLMFVVLHEGIVLLAVLFQWFGYAREKRGAIIFASLLLLFAAFELFVLLIPLLVLVPIALINLIVGNPKQKT